jgi:hypothetical protein
MTVKSNTQIQKALKATGNIQIYTETLLKKVVLQK